jgi:hypothetical protein
MRFAFTRHRSAVEPALNSWLAKVAADGCEPYAVLDGSMFEPAALDRLARLAVNLRPALAGSPLSIYGNRGPLLWSVGSGDTPGLRALLRQADGIPGLSFVACRADRAALSARLIWLAMAHQDDGPPMHCRFADTRVLPSLLDRLTADQGAVLTQEVAEWAWIARDATLRVKAFAPTNAVVPSAVQERFSLDPAQFDGLLADAEPDMVFQMLDEKMFELIPEAPPHEVHARLAGLIDAARGHGITDLPDLFQYAVVGFSTTDHFDLHPAVQETWQRLKNGDGRFGEVAEQWPDNVWKELEESSAQELAGDAL